MNFFFFTSVAFENWDYNNSIRQGIGGSETSIVEMSWRLAARGHNVTVYAPIKKTTKSPWRNVIWKRFEKATFKEPGVWVIYRVPEAIDKVKKKPSQQFWLLWQDWDYPNLNKQRIKNYDHHITLCKSHGNYMLDRYPLITKNQLWLSSNGIKLDLIEKIQKENIKRDPFRVMYASSPDRGLIQALKIVKKAREFEPRINFHFFYGFNNLDKLIKGRPDSPLAKNKAEVMELMKQKNVFFHGRIPQPQLMREWFKSGIYMYVTNFFETSHISGMEAQACGAVPIFSPIYAQGENIQHGIGVLGDSNDSLTISRASAELLRLAGNVELQAKIRSEMILWARKRFYWEVMVDQWIAEAEGKRKEFEKQYEFPNQL